MVASIIKRIASTSGKVSNATLTIPRLRGLWALCRPGVSRSTNWWSWPLTIPMIRLRVVCGLGETMDIFWPSRQLRRVDLPTLGGPMRAMTPVLINLSSELGMVESKWVREKFLSMLQTYTIAVFLSASIVKR